MARDRESGNPFDRKSNPLVTIVVHTPSLEDGIRQEGTFIHRLLRLGATDELEIVCLPDEHNRPIDSPSVIPSRYLTASEEAALEVGSGTWRGVPIQRGDIPFHPVERGSSLRCADLGVARSDQWVDWFVVGKHVLPEFERHPVSPRVWVTDPADCLELIRILLTGNDRYYLTPKRRCNSSFYYNYRARTVFKLDDFKNCASSLSYRCQYFLRATDAVLYLGHQSRQPFDFLGYHLAYSMMLLTGILEDIQSEVQRCHSIKIKSTGYFDLRAPDEKANAARREFFGKIEQHNPQLHEYLTDERIAKAVKAAYEIRRIVAHAGFLQPIDLAKSGIHFEVTLKRERLEQNDIIGSWFAGQHDRLLNPIYYVWWATDFASAFVSRVLSLLRPNHNLNSKSVWQTMKLPEPPLYF